VDRPSPFAVPALTDLLGGLVHRHRQSWLALGRLESRALADELAARPIDRPLYVCGLARSGSTLLHHLVTAHPGVATHRVKDFPLVFTPYWWRQATARLPATAARERSHGDRVLINSDSPEALEEMVWMAFFPRCHDPAVSGLLGRRDRHPAFEAFYRAHVGKVVLAERAARYAAKANYHVARLPYLLRLFPDARFLLPVRSPVGHVASLVRQHRRFSEGQRRYRRALASMRRSGHFEFGLDRRPLHLGDAGRVRAVLRAWAAGQEVRGWARYWAMVHDYLADLLAADAGVRSAALVVRFEDLCAAPAERIEGVLRHCGLLEAGPLVAAFAPRVSRPDYYQSPLGAAEVAVIHEETASAAARWGYP
jgi:hypothetical protein